MSFRTSFVKSVISKEISDCFNAHFTDYLTDFWPILYIYIITIGTIAVLQLGMLYGSPCKR
jgi:hypothetical protein